MALSYKPAINIQNNFATTSSTTASYTQLEAASSMPTYQSGKLQYFNSSTQVLKLAYGASGTEQDWLTIPPTVVPVVIEALFPGTQRLSMKAVSANATSGWLTLDFFI